MSTDDNAVSRRGFIRAAAGAGAVAGTAGTAAGQEDDDSDSGDGSYPGSGETEEVTVGPGGNLVFEPEELEILQGTTVNFVWDSDGHNVVPDSQPEDANWEGTGEQLEDSGFEYSHTFETLGTFEYVCTPHASAGMVGTIEVVEEISTPAPASGPPEIPDSAKTLGVAASIGMASTLGLAYFLMRFGGDYGDQ
jgi:plastocyanin